MYPNLKAEMARRDITNRILSEKIGMPLTSFYDKIAGRKQFTLRECMKIKEFFGNEFTIEYLFATK